MADEFLNELRQWVYSKFCREDFPEDVTRLVLRHVRATPELYAKYQVRSLGVADQLHKDIGKLVKEILAAEVVRKPNCNPDMIRCNPATDLVASCTRLRPSGNGGHSGVRHVASRTTSAKPDNVPKTDAFPEPHSAAPTRPSSSGEAKASVCFPFGQPLQELRQDDRSPKKVFVLGVYASAVHARWIGPDDRDVVRAFAVASEPYIFWRGEGADTINELSESQAKVLVLLGDLPIKWFLKFNDPCWSALSDFEPYGRFHDVVLGGRCIQVLPLTHPKNAGRLGASSDLWSQRHEQWVRARLEATDQRS